MPEAHIYIKTFFWTWCYLHCHVTLVVQLNSPAVVGELPPADHQRISVHGFIILVFQEYTSKNQDFFILFFITYVQFQDFSGPEKWAFQDLKTFQDQLSTKCSDMKVRKWLTGDFAALGFCCLLLGSLGLCRYNQHRRRKSYNMLHSVCTKGLKDVYCLQLFTGTHLSAVKHHPRWQDHGITCRPTPMNTPCLNFQVGQ